MHRHVRTAVVLTAATLIGGCSIAGTWNTVKTEPADAEARSPFQVVTFNDEGGYTATGEQGSKVITATGTYQWDGAKLTVHPSDGETRVYPGHLNIFTEQLVLTHKSGDEKMTAWFEKVEEGG